MSEAEQNTTETTEATVEKKAKGPGVGAYAKELIQAGKTNQEVLDAVKEKFPEAKTSMSSVNWYRNKMRSDGDSSVKTSREIKAANKPEKAPKEKKVRAKKAKDAAPAEAADILG